MKLELNRSRPHIRVYTDKVELVDGLEVEVSIKDMDKEIFRDINKEDMEKAIAAIKRELRDSKLIKYTTESNATPAVFLIEYRGNPNDNNFVEFSYQLEKLMKISDWTQIYVILVTDKPSHNGVLESYFDFVCRENSEGELEEDINLEKGAYIHGDVINELIAREYKHGRKFEFTELKDSLQGKTREKDTYTEVRDALKHLKSLNYIKKETNEVYEIVIDTILW